MSQKYRPQGSYLARVPDAMDIKGASDHIIRRIQRELDPRRTYHSLAHALDVQASALEIARLEQVHGEDLQLLEVAAIFHDCGFLVASEDHEEAGRDIIRSVLPTFGFNERQVERVGLLIMATRVPQCPEDRLARILCDADLDYLGRTDFRPIGNTLFQELHTFGFVDSERAWNELQVRFISAHRYFTRTNQLRREPMKQANLQEVRDWLERDAPASK